MNDADLVSIEDAAKILFVARSRVRQLIAEEKLSSALDDGVLLAEVLGYNAQWTAEARRFLDWHADEFVDDQT